MMVYIGVDLGGTNIKAGVVDDEGRIIRQASIPTGHPRGEKAICDDIVALSKRLLEESGFSLNQVAAIGIGSPGTMNPDTGTVIYGNNLDWKDVPLKQYVSEGFGENSPPVYIENDANVAAFGELYAGSAKGAESAVVLTIGTGLGSGSIINSKIINGHFHGGGEFGHMVVERGGKPCTCGRRGCVEAYASATGLIGLTRDEMERSPDSLMHKLAKERGKVTGKTSFDAMKQGDEAGARVVDLFIDYLACFIANIINALQPEVISIGGGVSNEGDTLLIPLREKVSREVYGGPELPSTEIRICTLGNDAGIVGAAMMGKSYSE